MSQTYSDVDSSGDPVGAAVWQERMATWPAVAAYKRRAVDLLSKVEPVLDVGCGPGGDLVAVGRERSIGIDTSQVMCSRAAARGAVVARGEADALPFRAASFAGARADRVFQHLAHPDEALQELLRVLKPGGRVVIVDPDQETLVIHVPGVRQRVLDRLRALRRDLGYRNGRLIARLPELLAENGAGDITVDAYPLVLRDPADAFGLPNWPRTWQVEGSFTDDELAEWDRALRTGNAGFLYSLTFLVVSGHNRR